MLPYDRGGNLTSREKFAYTTGALGTRQQLIPYYYNDSNWRDKLTNYNGTAITYDGIGNVVNDGTWYYMWRGGRQLTSAQHGSQVVRYYYNHDGLRVRKTVDNVPTDYTLNGAQITHLKKGSGNDSDWMHFWYDGQGRPAIVNYNGTIYHYVYNLQGDVIALLDDSNSIVVEYKYDAWGKLLGKTGSLASTLGTLNPFRYRGYVYDEETGLYYLRSRYYNPEWGRFISADALLGKTGALLSHNLFAYCRNNPVIRRDENGQADNDSPLSLFEYIIVHEAVVFRVSMKVGGGYVHRLMTAIPNAGRHGGFGFADVIDREGNVWEIKHKSERNIVLGDVQLEAYCNWGGLTRGYDITIESFTIQLPGREILVKVDGANRVSGLVLYSIESLNNSHEYSLAPEAQARTSTSSNKQEGSSIGFALLGFAAACGVGMSIETISSRPRICLSIW